MDSNKNFLDLLDEIANNGVRFMEVYFRTDLPTDCLFDEKGEVCEKFMTGDDTWTDTLVITFSDGKHHLADLVLTSQQLSLVLADAVTETDGEHSIALANVSGEIFNLSSDVSVELFVNGIKGLTNNTAGKAMIQYWPTILKKD